MVLVIAVAGCSASGDTPSATVAYSETVASSSFSPDPAKSFEDVESIGTSLTEAGVACTVLVRASQNGISVGTCEIDGAATAITVFPTARQWQSTVAQLKKDPRWGDESRIIGPNWGISTTSQATAQQIHTAIGGELFLSSEGSAT